MSRTVATVLKLMVGPLAFVAAYSFAPDGLTFNSRVVLATFLWAALWWVAQPIPWAVTSLLPLVLFPLAGVMKTGDTVALYGQNIFFWIFGTVMLGYAMEKHGLAKRFALRFLSIKGVASTTYRLTFMYMLATALLSMFVSDAAAVAIMIPIGMSLVGYLGELRGGERREGKSALAAFFALGALCASQAGGMATIVGLPHNALAVALASSLAEREIGWFQWMMVGIPLSSVMLTLYYWILRYFSPPEYSSVPGGSQFIEREVAKLGKWKRGEVNVLIAFICMLILFVLPTILSLVLGSEDPIARGLKQAVPIWVVPPFILIMLFLLPVNLRTGETTLVWRDAVEHAPWNIMILCAGALAMTDALTDFGFMDFIRQELHGLGVGRAVLPYAAATVVGLSTNVISGLAATSLFCTIFIPMASEIGFNPASIAMLIPNTGLGIIFPWAGAAAGTAFATGYLDIKEMIKIGAVATVFLILLSATIHLLFSPIF